MPTGYEVRMYEDVTLIREAMQKIATELKTLRELAELVAKNVPAPR